MTTWTTNPTLSKALENLPEGWRVARLGYEAWVRARLGWKGLTADEYVEDGYIFLATPNIKGKDIDFEDVNFITEERYHESPEIMLRAGDVLLTKDGATIGIVNRVRDLPRPATVNGSIAVITPTGDLTSRYLEYVLLSEYAQALMRFLQGGMGVPHLFQWDINRMSVPCPPADEQRAIADFLDRETAQIDAMIEAQQELVRGLQERREGVMRSAVIGSESSFRRKASGQAWFGDLPEHWDVRPLGSLFQTIGSGTTPANDLLLDAEEGEVPWVTTSELRERAIWATNQTLSRETLASTPALRMYGAGTLLVAMYGATIGRMGWLETAACTNQACCAFSGPRDVLPEFVFFALLAAREHLIVLGTGGGQPNLNQQKLRALRLPVPPLHEQLDTVTRLISSLSRTDAMIDAANDSIAFMLERRAALISAAVTGLIDPRTGIERAVSA